MKTIPLKNDRWRVFLDTSEYRNLLECAYEPESRTVRQVVIVIRLMACSLRIGTVSDLTYGQFEQRSTPVGDYWVCKVRAKDSTRREAETRPRAVFIPQDLMEQIHQRAHRFNLGPDDELFPCSYKTIQRDIKRSAANAAVATGNEEFRKLSAHDLRRYFATHLLFRHEVPPSVVRVLGGWKSDEAMFEYLVLPDDILFERLGEAGLLETPYDKLSRHDRAEKTAATASRLVDLLDGDDQQGNDGSVEALRGVFDGIESITVNVDSSDSGDATDGSSDQRCQSSFRQFGFDPSGVADPLTAAKAAYVAALSVVSWSVTVGPLW